MTEAAVFFFLASVTLGSAFAVVLSRTVLVSALWLILSFIGVAGMYALMGASFLAVTQVLIYVGAISVLLLFAIMLTHDVMGEQRPMNRQWPIASMVTFGLFVVLGIVMFRADWPLTGGEVPPALGGVIADASGVAIPRAEAEAPAFSIADDIVADDGQVTAAVRIPGTVASLGRSLMTEHLLAFEVISIVLLVALIGAIVIARD